MGKGKLIFQNEELEQQKVVVKNQQKTESTHKKSKKKKTKHISKQHDSSNGKLSTNNINNNNSNIQRILSEKQQNKSKMLPQKQNQQQKAAQNQQENQLCEPQNQAEQPIKLKHLAIALPDSILQLPQTSQLRAYFISEVARISSIFKVDQIIILRDHAYVAKSQNFNPSQYMVRNLQYLETPQYLRKHLFKLHSDLKNAGLMNPIQCQHHLKTDEPCEFRQGVALDRPSKKGSGSWVDIGLKQQASMSQLVMPLTRVTLRLENHDDPDAPFYKAQAVSKKVPRQQQGLYWGYDVRMAKNLKDMFRASQSGLNQEEYDIKLLCNHTKQSYNLPQIEHFYQISDELKDSSVLIFFAGTDDLSSFVQRDSRSKISKQDAIGMFDCCMRFQGYGVKQLRIEEQLFITLSKICEYAP